MNGDGRGEDGLTPEERRRRRRQQRRDDDSADAVDYVELVGEASGGDSGFPGSGGRGSGGRADTGSVPGSRGPGSSGKGSGVPDGGPSQGAGAGSGPNSGGGSHAGGGDIGGSGGGCGRGGGSGCDCDLPCGCDLLVLRLSALLWLAAVLVPARAGTRPVLALLRGYRRWLTRFTPRCPSSPSCSSYALDAVQALGARRGLAAAARRVRDCGRPPG